MSEAKILKRPDPGRDANNDDEWYIEDWGEWAHTVREALDELGVKPGEPFELRRVFS
jgi:hypothetical protein